MEKDRAEQSRCEPGVGSLCGCKSLCLVCCFQALLPVVEGWFFFLLQSRGGNSECEKVRRLHCAQRCQRPCLESVYAFTLMANHAREKGEGMLLMVRSCFYPLLRGSKPETKVLTTGF